MMRVLILPILLAASSGAARYPAAGDVVEAYAESARHFCIALIDQCDEAGPVVPSSPEQIEALACTGRAVTATCRFRFLGSRCTARFVLHRTGGARRWIVERRPARVYGRPQVDCRD